MKGIKKISILALGLAFVLSVSACKGKKNTTTDPETTPTTEVTPTTPTSTETEESTTPIPDYVEFEDLEAALGDKSTLDNPENYPDIYINEEAKVQYKLMNVTVYTNYARTKFYLGEEFSAEGIVVLANFLALDENGDAKLDSEGKSITVLAKVTTFGVDASAVDTSTLGLYSVLVNYRYGETQTQTQYNISVSSSEFETTKNLQYTAGIKAGYKDGATPKQIDPDSIYKTLTNDGRIYTTYVNYTKKTGFINDYALNPTDLNISIINNQVNAVGTAFKTISVDYDNGNLVNDTTNKKMTSKDGKLTIDYSSVNTGKVGSYIVPVVYDAGDIVINKETRKNVVKSFIVVDVINPIQGLYLEDGVNPEINASLDGIIDLSNYEITVERKYGPEEVMAISPDKFTVTGALTYIEGKHTVKITANELMENGNDISYSTEINIKPSEIYNISQVTNFAGGDEFDIEVDKNGKKTVGRYEFSDVFNAYGMQTTDSQGNVLIDAKPTQCAEDKLNFDGYVYMNQLASDSYLEFKFDKPGVLILYIGSGSSDERLFGLYENSGVLLETYTATLNKVPEKFVIEIPDAGTYKVAAVGKAITFHGFITAIKK